MPKVLPSGRYRPSSVQNLPLSELVRYVKEELEAVGDAIEFGRAAYIEFLDVVPQKPFEGLTVGADGTNWNPGAGKGVYTYYSGAWNKLG